MSFPEVGDYKQPLNQIKEACKGIWENRQRHEHYTDHGIKHSERIISDIEKLLEGLAIKKTS